MELKSKSIKVSKYNIEIGYTEGLFEIMYVTDGKPTLTDVCIVDMDEYLDLLNLKLTIKSNNENKYP